MSNDKRDILEVLKFELNFLEQGGYGRSVRTPWKPTSLFQDSVTCMNFNDPKGLILAMSVCCRTSCLAARRKRTFLATTFP